LNEELQGILGANLIYKVADACKTFIHQTCDEASLLAKIGGTENFQSHDSSDLSYNFYTIDNPTEYLKGSDAIAVEKGPYMMK
jgi:hypothetical protein